MSKKIVGLLLSCSLSVGIAAQSKTKPWREWTDKEAQKILNDSAWGQTQIAEDLSEMFYSPTSPGQVDTVRSGRSSPASVVSGNNRSVEGALNQATGVTFRIRWLSARPIRQALARQMELQAGRTSEQLIFFAEGPSEKRTVIAVTFEAKDQRFGGRVMQVFNAATTSVLKNTSYLERKDGKRIFVQAYVSPEQNPLGAALFVFPRTIDDQPLLTVESGEVRFVAEFNKDVKLDMKYKVAQMVYAGQLEY